MIDDEVESVAAVANRVSAFYERHPYPAAVDDLKGYRELWDDARRRADSHLFWPAQPYRDDRSILVAGCGTSQAAKYAVRWPRAKVTGIDVSATSLAATERLRRRYGLDNLEIRQMAVEDAAQLGQAFEHIVCTGVLHHLADPRAGLRALQQALAPEGALHLMVYAPYGRAGVYLLHEYCRRLGIGATAAEIRDLAQALDALPRDHPIAPLLHSAPDFRSDAGLADALLHPRDRSYSAPQLMELLDDAGLRFGRWTRQAAYLPHCGRPAATPHHERLAALPPAEQYAAMELFRGSMVRHSLTAYRSDHPDGASALGVDREGWTDLVPVRLADTLAVRERLPPGAAAVLINRSHTYTDLFLPIDAREHKLLTAVDGKRSIAEIAGNSGSLDAAREFFRRLWRYDQVVFDASRDRRLR
ncbi:class I SAM-dependent methyltransferase [Phenylobacterium sp.]|uniref:class I SAM-dependent methyltransferase n=1 Tax=Phenylobacterium sp. TaxID=1871053 RepID=UPI002E330509|nr:class I SAM-dependent methyltransferase [Phenylobacterium sp.]HEX4709144.1 class I SAM-dependent methyltransferase [Phenylobacterium sp.]